MKIVIPGGSGQVGTVLARALQRGRARRRRPQPRGPAAALARRRLGRRDRSGPGRTRWTVRRRDQPGRPQRELPLHARRIAGRSWTRAWCRRGWSEQAIARAGAPAPRLAAGEHRDDLRAPLRRAERRGVGAASAAASRTRRARGSSASTSRAPGRRRSTRRLRPRTRKVALRSAMTMSPDRGRHLRYAARSRAPRARRARRRRPAVRLVDPRRGLRRRRALADRPRRRRGRREPRLAESAAERGVHARPARRPRACRSGCRPREWMLEIGAVFMRTETELILKSRRVVPGRLLDAGLRLQVSALARCGPRPLSPLAAGSSPPGARRVNRG